MLLSPVILPELSPWYLPIAVLGGLVGFLGMLPGLLVIEDEKIFVGRLMFLYSEIGSLSLDCSKGLWTMTITTKNNKSYPIHCLQQTKEVYEVVASTVKINAA